MSIAELLANKRKALKPVILEKTEEGGEEIEYRPRKTLNYDEIDKKLFLAMHAPYIQNPYEFEWFSITQWGKFLFPDGTYVLNTFQQMDLDRLFQVYVSIKKPTTMYQYSQIIHTMNHIYLYMPKEFEPAVHDLIINS